VWLKRLIQRCLHTLALLALSLGCSRSRPAATGADLARVRQWWILIGHANALESVDWGHHARNAQMVILNDDPRIPLGQLPKTTIRLAYLSLGEADPQRPYWSQIRGKSFLVEANPNWPDNFRVDIRDKRWQELLLGQEIPRLLRLGFQGFMLDTLDTAPYLERLDAARFAGSRQALRDVLRLIRQAYPQVLLVANGTDSLTEAAPFVDGYMIESVFAIYDFARHTYRQTTPQERSWKLAQIDRAQTIARRPVFTIEYASVGDVALAQWAEAEASSRGFRPYVAVKDINTLP
jgi:uncharacterized protein (TIGR01370 family)